MIDLLLLGILILGIFVGLRRGFILQLLHVLGFIVSFIIAVLYYDDLSPRLNLWIPYPELPADSTWGIFLETLPLENAFYNAVSFALLFFGAKIVLQIIANMLDFVATLPILNVLNGWLGAVLGFIETYVLLFIVLYIAALVPIDFVQSALGGSGIASFMIEHTPILSKQIETLWFEHVASIFSTK
ncbi:CvpA family protein [Radiobacillus kanasensis]|uniref:CvpA family protein n=1 Tax=Radiobacillus kanasensis TaxID=2844358 RepID=UPI001E64677E|nr:CvpA family protein [Radiobacillus kanasensis]UFT97978.1 CvpA family protein [Radiobacillus kanasensis]